MSTEEFESTVYSHLDEWRYRHWATPLFKTLHEELTDRLFHASILGFVLFDDVMDARERNWSKAAWLHGGLRSGCFMRFTAGGPAQISGNAFEGSSSK